MSDIKIRDIVESDIENGRKFGWLKPASNLDRKTAVIFRKIIDNSDHNTHCEIMEKLWFNDYLLRRIYS